MVKRQSSANLSPPPFRSGRVSVAQYLSLDHPNTMSNDEGITLAGKINAVLTVTDSDGDTATDTVGIGSKIVFDDDGPSVEVSTSHHDEIIHDETQGLQDDDVAGPLSVFAGVANAGDDPHVAANPIGFAQGSDGFLDVDASFGSDGPGGVAYALRLTSNGTDSGLDTTEGKDIKLFLENGIVVGRYDVGGGQVSGSDPAAFAIHVDPVTGKISLIQYVSIKHGDDDSSDDLETIDGNKVFVDVKVTDGDGDYATDSVDLGKKIGFDDDGPTLTLGSNAGFSLVHDESAGLQDNDSAGALPSFFNGLASQYNNDPHALPNAPANGPIGFASTAIPAFTAAVASYGADGPGAPAVKYTLDLQGSNGTSSGLSVNDVNGQPKSVHLFQVNDNLIVGRFDRTGDGNDDVDSNDPAAFAIAIDPATGVLHLVQYLSINHSNSNPDLDADEIAYLANNLIKAVMTIEDGDGDTDSEFVFISGGIGFSDDGPTADITVVNGASITLDETDGDSDDSAGGTILAQKTVSGALLFTQTTATFGADSARDYNDNGSADSDAKVFSLVANNAASGLVDAVSNQAITLVAVSGGVEGRIPGNIVVFRAMIDADDGDVTVTQYCAVEHDDLTDHDESASPEIMDAGALLLKMTLTDDDGDTASDTIDLGALIKFEDDGPKLTANAAAGTVEEDDLNNAQGVGNNEDPSVGKTVATGSLSATVNAGLDGAAIGGGFSLDASALASLPVLLSKGVQLAYTVFGRHADRQGRSAHRLYAAGAGERQLHVRPLSTRSITQRSRERTASS